MGECIDIVAGFPRAMHDSIQIGLFGQTPSSKAGIGVLQLAKSNQTLMMVGVNTKWAPQQGLYPQLDCETFLLNCGISLLSGQELATEVDHWVLLTVVSPLGQDCTHPLIGGGIRLQDELLLIQAKQTGEQHNNDFSVQNAWPHTLDQVMLLGADILSELLVGLLPLHNGE